jgi:aspartyl-tRNA(Asn)/glutamyl-tRNA(Gln) amidotransferase subunit C
VAKTCQIKVFYEILAAFCRKSLNDYVTFRAVRIWRIKVALNDEDIRKIAWLARLQIDEVDSPKYAGELSQVLDLVDQLNQIDTDNIEPMAHPTDAVQRLREDVVTEDNQREKFQSIAPQAEAGLYLVPKVIE